MTEMTGCKYLYHTEQCSAMAEEMNYEILMGYQSSRLALHTGDRSYSPYSGSVRWILNEDLMQSESSLLLLLMDSYKVIF